MSWSFSRKTRRQKPAVQLKQEAAVVLALGGGYQAYFKQDRDGALRDPAEMDVMAEVAAFCRQRQDFCHHSVAVPQIALLYSRAGHYRSSPALFNPYGGDGVGILQEALQALLENQQAVQILSEHQLDGEMDKWPLIVVPGWSHLDPAFRDQLADYVTEGGRLLLIGAGPTALFERELEATKNAADPRIVAVPEVGEQFIPAVRRLFPQPVAEVSGASHVDVSPRKLNGKLAIHLVNTAGPHANAPPEGILHIPAAGPFKVAIRLAAKPAAVIQQPEGNSMEFAWSDGQAIVNVPKLEMYSILEIVEGD